MADIQAEIRIQGEISAAVRTLVGIVQGKTNADAVDVLSALFYSPGTSEFDVDSDRPMTWNEIEDLREAVTTLRRVAARQELVNPAPMLCERRPYEGAGYHCNLNDGHDGPHSDLTLCWNDAGEFCNGDGTVI